MRNFIRELILIIFYGTAIIENKVDFDLLKKAISIFLDNHDSFHLELVLDNNEMKQTFNYKKDFNIEILDIDSKDDIKTLENDLINHVFDIYHCDNFFIKIFRLSDGSGGFIVNIHHLFADSWSLGILANDIVRIYSCLLNGEDVVKNDNFSYLNYINSEKEYFKSDKFKKDKEYWSSIFNTIPEQATIPSSKPDSTNGFLTKACRRLFNIDKDMIDKISDFCKSCNVSVFNFFMAVFSIYIGRVNNSNDFVIGTPILNRTNYVEKNTTGMFINTAPLRILVDDDSSFKSFVSNVAKDSLGMLRHQKYYYQTILEDLRKNDPSLPNLYNILISYQVTRAATEKGVNYWTRWIFNGNTADDIDIHLYDLNSSGSIDVAYDYKVSKYSNDDIEDIHNRILHIIYQILEKNDICLKDIEILTAKEKHEILYKFNDTKSDYPKEKNIIDLFEEQAKKTPNNIAIVFEDKKLTYKELNEKANGLAKQLLDNGISKGDVVGVHLKRSFELIISIFAIMKCNAVYFPIYTGYPLDRINYMLENSSTKLIITNNYFDNPNLNKIILNNYLDIPSLNIELENIRYSSQNIAYIIYTSGSTGKPKGVQISHSSLINFIYAFTNYFDGIDNNDNFLSSTNISFDVSMWEIFMPILNGATLVLYNEEIINDIMNYCNTIINNKITALYIPPNILNEVYSILENNKNSCINKILVGVEPIKKSTLNKFFTLNPDMKIVNGYGPTETTVCCTALNYRKETNYLNEFVSIGKPLLNNSIYILDSNMLFTPIGVVGELYVTGSGVGAGYINNPVETNKNYLDNKFDNRSTKIYKTGDLGKWNSDGSISLIGRRDNQVKISGYRIELSEIDAIIAKYPSITKSLTVVYKSNSKDYLVSYFTAKNKVLLNDLINFLITKLPIYMIPKSITQLESFPINSNGKIDKNMLPTPILKSSSIYVAPVTESEIKLCDIWCSLFEQDKIGIDDNFFELGGDSLLSIKLTTHIYNVFNIKLGISSIFENNTIRLLANFLDNSKKENKIDTICVATRRNNYPLSSAQKRIYYASCLDLNSTIYNIAGGIIIDNLLDVEKLKNCFNILINRHDALRTHFEIKDNDIVQIIDDRINFNLELDSAVTDNLNDIYSSFVKPFDLSIAPLFRTKLVKLKDNKMLLLLDMHHIISDGTSLAILLQELCDLYNGSTLSKKQIDYTDFTLWEKEQFKKDYFNNEKNYWVNQFSDEIPLLNMPTTYPRPSTQSFEGSNYYATLSKTVFDKVNGVSKELNITPYMLLLSCYYILLSKYSSNDDIVIGTPIIGRNSQELHDVLGMFVNTLALRNKVNTDLTFDAFSKNIRKNCINSFKNQDYPFDMLVKDLNVKRDSSRNPLFDVMFVYQNNGYPKINFNNTQTKYFIPDSKIAKFDLTLEIIPVDNEFSLRFEYCTKLFDEDFIKSLSSHYINILDTVLENCKVKISDIDMLSNDEKDQILSGLNDTYMDYPKNKTIAKLFEEQVEKTPDNIAVVFEDKKLTYEELNKKANQLAKFMLDSGIKQNSIVGIMLPRSVEILISMLATLKLNACYIPIDPTLPKDRINYMLNNSNASTLLTFEDISNNVIVNNYINVKLDNSQIYNCSVENLNLTADLSLPAYIIYTSGSTGTPKGVMLNNKALTNLACYLNNKVDFLKNEYSNMAIASITTISFDIFIFETLICLQRGLKIVLANELEQNTPNLLNELIAKNDIKAIQMTPSRMHIFMNNRNIMPNLCDLKYIVLAGEALPKDLLDSILELGDITVYNGYGPSETTVFSSFTDVTNYKKITIGKPLSNTNFYILDKDMNLCPIGIPGELFIGGDGVGIEYINNKEMTQERFIKSPFDNSTIYRTGDLVKYLPNGEIDYIGRIDNQVKIRGLRIELGEIESCILKYPNVDKCVITATKDMNDRQFIVAYLTVKDRISTNKLREFLKDMLPKYMVPSYFVILDEMPYLNNGKINKKALPSPVINSSSTEYIAPKGRLQLQITNIFQSLLSVSPIGINDNFFELGGDSLLAINLQIELLKLCDNITYSDVFMYSTVKDLADRIQNNKKGKADILDAKDFAKFDDILKKGIVMPNAFSYKSLGNIILSGATGFLGAHVLDAFLTNESGIAYCLIRPEPGLTLENKFINKLHFYFGNKYDDMIGSRIIIVNSDICIENLGLSNNELYDLSNSVSCVINCAAKVSHYGDYSNFKKVNVTGVENLVKFCMQYDKRFYHVSTLSVSGNGLVDQSYIEQDFKDEVTFTEDKFYIGQSLDNVYVRSKFEAERLVFNSILNGLDGYIFRVGNLMNRFSDGKFQPNVYENAYISRLLSFALVGYIPDYLFNAYMEFTPIDSCANAIIKIMEYSNSNNRVFHLFNHNNIDVDEFVKIFNKYSNINVVDNNIFLAKIDEILRKKDSSNILSGIIKDFNDDRLLVYKSNIKLESDFTVNYLNNIGYNWPQINEDYIKKFINYFYSINYLRRKEGE